MKKYIVILPLFILLTHSYCFGQAALQQGNYQLGGSVGFERGESTNDYFHDRYTMLELAPQYSYFVADNLLIGGNVSFKYSEYEWLDMPNSLSLSREIGVGPIVKYYITTESVIPFIGASATYYKYLGEDQYGYNLVASCGVDIFIAQSLAIEPFIQYDIMNYYHSNSTQKTTSFGLRLNYFIIK